MPPMEMEDFERRFGRASREPLQAILDQHDTVTREVLVEMWESLHESCEGDVRRSSCYAPVSYTHLTLPTTPYV